MNKKISTLIAGIFLAGIFPVVSSAQVGVKHNAAGLDLKAEIPYRTQLTKPDAFDVTYNHYGVNKIDPNKWYQLEVTGTEGGQAPDPERGLASPVNVEAKVLVQLRNYDTGELYLKAVSQELLETGTLANQGMGDAAIVEPSLNSSLWKIEVVDRHAGAFMYKFTNKETGYQISYNCNDAVNLQKLADLPTSQLSKPRTINKSDVNAWRWYTADENSTGEDFNESKPYTFNHDSEKVLGFAINSSDEVVLVDIPASEVTGDGQQMVPGYNILKFTIRNAGARVLNAADINSMIDADGSWANRDNSDLIAKFKEVLKGFKGNDFFTTKYKAIDTQIDGYKNTDLEDYAGYSIVLKANGTDDYFMVATDATYESDKLPSAHGGLKVLNAPFDGELTTGKMTALKARYHWKVTYFATPDSLAFEPLNASFIADADKRAGKKWSDTPLENAAPEYYFNTVNEGFAHPYTGAISTTNVPFNKAPLGTVALTLMNASEGIDSQSVLTIGSRDNAVGTKHFKSFTTSGPTATHYYYKNTGKHDKNPSGFYQVGKGPKPNAKGTHYQDNRGCWHETHQETVLGKYGSPVLTDEVAQMGLKIQFDHNFTYLKRTSVKDNVYFIKVSVDSENKTDYRKEGMYLVYNMEGRLMYDMPDDYQNYEAMPATQWVIETDSCDFDGKGTPYVTIRNREYGNQVDQPLFYGQLYQVTGTNKYYIINHQDYDVKSDTNGKFSEHILSCGDTIYFTAVKDATKKDEYLGYKRFTHENLKYETYAVKYLNAPVYGTPNTNNFLSVDEASKFLSINASLWNDFEIDTLLVDEEFGYTGTKAGAVQLKRTAYALKVRDNNLIDNQWRYVVVKEDDNSNPYYQMAHLKDVDGKNVKLGTFYFKADQITAEETAENAFAFVDATGWSKKAIFHKEGWIGAQKDSVLNLENPDEEDPYDLRLYRQNGYKRVDVKDQTAKVSFMSLNTAPMDRVSAFVFTDNPRPLYKTIEEGVAQIFRQRGGAQEATEYLYEDAHNSANLTAGEYIQGFNYLGITAENVKPVGKESTTAVYVDKVINSHDRMPKYLFFVAPDSVADGQWCKTGQHGYFPNTEEADKEDATHHVFYNGYLAGRVLINLNDSVEKYIGHDMLEMAHKYGYRNYTRLGFVEAIHMYVTEEEAAAEENAFGFDAGEYLFVFNATTLANVTSKWDVVDPVKLNKAIEDGLVDVVELNANHQNVAFSLRLTEDEQKDILLESKGLNVEGSYGTFSEASWVNILNGVPVLAQKYNINGDHTEIDGTSNLSQLVNQAQIFRVEDAPEGTNPTSNDTIDANEVAIIGGNGIVTIQGAAGKKISISNILGQTVASTVLSSDNTTISAPKGIVVVTVEGEKSVKTIVK